MKNLYLSSIFLAAFAQALTSQAFGDWSQQDEADDTDAYYDYSAMSDQTPSPSQPKKQMMSPEDRPMDSPYGIPPPARPVVKNGMGWWLSAEGLLWQATEDNLYFAQVIKKPPFSETSPPVFDPLYLDFDWGWGFRVGAGYNFPRDHWDLMLDWTHIENRADKHKNISPDSDFGLDDLWRTPVFASGTEAGPDTHAKGRWVCHLDQIDMSLGREFYAGKRLTLRPNVGMRSAFILQKMRMTAGNAGGQPFSVGPVSNKVRLKNQFWGFGFRAGFDTDWKLGCGFSLYGDAAFALLFGYFKVSERGAVFQFGNTGINGGNGWKSRGSHRTEKPIFDLAMGLKWRKKFCDERYAVMLKAGYEYHLYMQQNQYKQMVGNSSQIVPIVTAGDLGYQGVTFGGQFDF